MSTPLTINIKGETYNYPAPGEDPGWGEGGADWATAVTDVLNSLLGPGDILERTFSLLAGASSANVTGLIFDVTKVSRATVDYSARRDSGFTEGGQISLAYDDNATAWTIGREYIGNAELDFTITAAGQIQYSSSAADGTGTLKFKASTLGK